MVVLSYKEKLSFSKVETLKESFIDASFGHEEHCKGLIGENSYWDLTSKGYSARFVLVELPVERNHFNFSFNASNRSIYSDLSIEPLVIDVLDHQSYIFFHQTITTRIHADLLKFPLTLSQILYSPFNYLILIFILTSMEANRYRWKCDHGHFVAVRTFPFW